jgi:hypothetical protein
MPMKDICGCRPTAAAVTRDSRRFAPGRHPGGPEVNRLSYLSTGNYGDGRRQLASLSSDNTQPTLA